jgi:hypothetical protein
MHSTNNVFHCAFKASSNLCIANTEHCIMAVITPSSLHYLPLSTLSSASSLQMNCRAAMVTTHSPLHAIFLHISLHSLLLVLTLSQNHNKIWHMLESLRMWTVDWACAWHNQTSVQKICNQACTHKQCTLTNTDKFLTSNSGSRQAQNRLHSSSQNWKASILVVKESTWTPYLQSMYFTYNKFL